MRDGGVTSGIDESIVNALETSSGQVARPRSVRIVTALPKNVAGGVARNVLTAISNRMAIGDLSRLSNPEVVETIRAGVQGLEVPVSSRDVADDILNFGTDRARETT
jgi:hypothetical protein